MAVGEEQRSQCWTAPGDRGVDFLGRMEFATPSGGNSPPGTATHEKQQGWQGVGSGGVSSRGHGSKGPLLRHQYGTFALSILETRDLKFRCRQGWFLLEAQRRVCSGPPSLGAGDPAVLGVTWLPDAPIWPLPLRQVAMALPVSSCLCLLFTELEASTASGQHLNYSCKGPISK